MEFEPYCVDVGHYYMIRDAMLFRPVCTNGNIPAISIIIMSTKQAHAPRH